MEHPVYPLDANGDTLGSVLCADCNGDGPAYVPPDAPEVDTPLHCEECHVMLDHTLTDEGIRYTLEAVVDGTGDPDVLTQWFDLLEDHNAAPCYVGDLEAFRLWADDRGDVYEAAETFEEAYAGCREASSPDAALLDYAYDFVDETGMLRDVPESFAHYFDYEAFARDLRLGGDVIVLDGPGNSYHLFHGWV